MNKYISEDGLTIKDVQSRLLKRMLEITDLCWESIQETSNLKTIEFLSSHIPRTLKMTQEMSSDDTELPDISSAFIWEED